MTGLARFDTFVTSKDLTWRNVSNSKIAEMKPERQSLADHVLKQVKNGLASR